MKENEALIQQGEVQELNKNIPAPEIELVTQGGNSNPKKNTQCVPIRRPPPPCLPITCRPCHPHQR
jgi:hypothetical protein